MVFSVIGAMAEYERNLTRERTMAGLAAARARGRKGGRPKQLDEGQVRVAIPLEGFAIALANAGKLTIKEICEQVGCSRSTYYRQVAPSRPDYSGWDTEPAEAKIQHKSDEK